MMSSGVILSAYAKYAVDLYLSVGCIVGKLSIIFQQYFLCFFQCLLTLLFRKFLARQIFDKFRHVMSEESFRGDNFPVWKGKLSPLGMQDHTISSPRWATIASTLLLFLLALIGLAIFHVVAKGKKFPPRRRTSSMKLRGDPFENVLILEKTRTIAGDSKDQLHVKEPPQASNSSSCDYLTPKPHPNFDPALQPAPQNKQTLKIITKHYPGRMSGKEPQTPFKANTDHNNARLSSKQPSSGRPASTPRPIVKRNFNCEK